MVQIFVSFFCLFLSLGISNDSFIITFVFFLIIYTILYLHYLSVIITYIFIFLSNLSFFLKHVLNVGMFSIHTGSVTSSDSGHSSNSSGDGTTLSHSYQLRCPSPPKHPPPLLVTGMYGFQFKTESN